MNAARSAGWVVVLIGVLFVAQADAAITIDGGPDYPAPGGNTWTPDATYDNPTESGGLKWDYGSFDLTETAELYFGLNNTQKAGLSMDGYSSLGDASNHISGSENFTFSHISGNSAYWTGTTHLYYLQSGYFRWKTVDTRMIITMTGAGSWVADATTAGLEDESDVGALWNVQGDFTMRVYMEAANSGSSTYYSADYYFDAHQNYPNHVLASTFATAFYWEENASVPEPVSLAVWGLLAGLGLTAARRYRTG